MTTLDTLRSVLEALKHPFNPETREPAITDLTALIANMEKAEPACPSCHAPGLMYECIACSASNYPKAEPADDEPIRCGGPGCDGGCCVPYEPKAEPVAWQERQSLNVGWSQWYYCGPRLPGSKTEMVVDHITYQWRPLYAAAPQAKPLTDEQIYSMYSEPSSDAEMLEFARAIEAAHGIGQKDGGRG